MTQEQEGGDGNREETVVATLKMQVRVTKATHPGMVGHINEIARNYGVTPDGYRVWFDGWPTTCDTAPTWFRLEHLETLDGHKLRSPFEERQEE